MSIEKGSNAYFHPSVNRLIEVSPDAQQITLHDQRYYRRSEGIYYPSVTTVLSYFPKNKFFETWVKDVGHNADLIMRRAGEEGTAVHTGVEKFLAGEEMRWIEPDGYVNYPTHVWMMIVKFADFWNTHKPELLASEVHLFSDEFRFAGTVDIVCKIGEDYWILDIKTSNAVHRTYDLQTAAYATAWNETHTPTVTRRGILWLKSTKRGPDKSGRKIQGDGWELKESVKTLEEDFNLFKTTYSLYEMENEEDGPLLLRVPNTVKVQ